MVSLNSKTSKGTIIVSLLILILIYSIVSYLGGISIAGIAEWLSLPGRSRSGFLYDGRPVFDALGHDFHDFFDASS